MHITLVVGARPNFMKVAPIIRELRKEESMTYTLVHTGQHYDEKLSHQFFRELEMPMPDVNLGVGSGSQAEQTSAIMVAFESFLLDNPTDLVLVVGDVTSTMACCLAAKKLHTRVAHVEGGIRSGDMMMPEEINRLVTDSISDYFFTTTPWAGQNLLKEGATNEQIYFVGNTMIDTLRHYENQFRNNHFYRSLGLEPKAYFVLTLHRPSNVDELRGFQDMMQEVGEAIGNIPVVFPVHPRTAKSLGKGVQIPDNFTLMDPLGYLSFMNLVSHSMGVVTDSGGIQEETTVLGVPCLTLRENTERPETITMGTNQLIGSDMAKLKSELRKIVDKDVAKGQIPELWDGNTAQRIVNCLRNL